MTDPDNHTPWFVKDASATPGYHSVSDGIFHVLAPTSIAQHVADTLNAGEQGEDLAAELAVARTRGLAVVDAYVKVTYGCDPQMTPLPVAEAIGGLRAWLAGSTEPAESDIPPEPTTEQVQYIREGQER